MTQANLPPLSPQQLLSRLDRLRRGAKRLSVLYGLGLIVLGGAALLVLGALADWLFRLPSVPRLIGLLATLALLGWAVWRYVWRPASRPLGIDEVAGRVEEVYPQFDDRLRSSVGFLARPDLADEPLRRRTIDEARELASRLPLSRVLRPRGALLSIGGAVAAVAVLVALALLLGPLAGTILGRLVDPLNPNHQWPKQYGVAPLVLPEAHPAGRPMPVVATLTKGDASGVEPTVLWQIGRDGPVGRQLMTRRDDGTFAASIDPRLSDAAARGQLRVWVEAGDDTTAPKPVELVRRPALVSAVARVTPPPYVPSDSPAARPIEHDLTAAPLVVGDGSTVELSLGYTKHLATADGAPLVDLRPLGDEPLPDLAWSGDGGGATATYLATGTARFAVRATGVDGFATDESPAFEVVVRPDRLPTIQIDQPRRNESRTAEAIVPLRATAEDDFGLEYVELVVEKLAPPGGSGWTATVPLLTDDRATAEPSGGEGGVRYRLAYDWPLGDVAASAGGPLEPGDVLEFHLRGKDNFDLNGRTHEPQESGRLRITIISQQELSRRVVGELQRARDGVLRVRQQQEATRRQTGEWAGETAEQRSLDEADREAADRLARQQSAAAAQARRLAETVGEIERELDENRSENEQLKQLAKDVADGLEQAAEGPMKSAALSLSRAGGENNPAPRGEAAEDAQQQQREATRQLDELGEQLESIGSLSQSVDSVAELLERQQELGERAEETMSRNVGRTAEEMSDADRAEMERVADEQEQLADETQAALERMQEQAEQMREDDAAAQAMKNAAQTAQQQGVTGQQRRAAQQQRQNNRSQSQQAQEQAEIGLQLVLSELRDAEREQLRELERKLAELAEQLDRLVRRQAGHNLDNLALRDEPAPDDLAALAARDEDNAVEPTVERLSASQEQTERNARNLAQPAEEASDGGDVAAALAKASARMERAAVSLRGRDVEAAYAPPQVEALAALVEARDAAEAERQRVEEELAEQARAAVREQLVQIRDEQVAEVNEPTAVVDAERQQAELPRRRLLQRINPIRPKQEDLVARVQEAEQALADVGGVAFVYAGRQARESMSAVLEGLARQQTDAGVQRQGDRAVARLDAMIDSLTLEPKDERFESASQQQGGGGDGEQQQQGPALPPEAELQLVKRLQQGVAEQTRQLDTNRDGDDFEQRVAENAAEQGEMRDVLNQMLRQYSQGKVGFGPEPDPETLLPEEQADGEDVEQQLDDRDLLDDLLGEAARGEAQGAGEGDGEGEAGEEEEDPHGMPAGGGQQVRQVGDYMARARQRLDLKRDPGAITQQLQQRVLENLDGLIDQARQNSQNSQSSSAAAQQQARRPQQQNRPGQEQANAAGQQANAGERPDAGEGGDGSAPTPPPGGEAQLSGEFEQSLAEWGNLTPRQREAIIDSRTDRPLDMYRRLTEEFYKRLSEQDQE